MKSVIHFFALTKHHSCTIFNNMREDYMKQLFKPYSFLFVFMIILIGSESSADTIMLYEGSVLVGKIISEDETSIIIANSFGTFRIKKIRIDDMYKTNSYAEDIEIHNRLKLPVNEDEIKKNYVAGQNKIEEKMAGKIGQEEKKPEEKAPEQKKAAIDTAGDKKLKTPGKKITGGDHWTSGRLSFSGSFLYNLGSSHRRLPYGYAGYFSLDQGLDFASGNRHPMIPGLRFEAGYLYFKKSSYTVMGYIGGGGLMWAFPSMKNSWGCFFLALLPGATLIEVKINPSYFSIGEKSRGIYFAGQALFGYQKSFGVFSIFLNARYLFIQNLSSRAYFHSVGGEFGFGFNAW
ncbi:MAG: hypothetical protein A2176_07475 [Spirochaetes bacterium RBG_13_51_14]|nr:MAG: hypothetical protein A2176_07475 [Spirochaetes bacterium RBG_13_51_14]